QNVEDLPVLRRLGVPDEKLHVLGNGIDLDHFDARRAAPGNRARLRAEWGIPDDAVVCGAVGRLVWEKGYRELIEAGRGLRDDAPSVRIVVVGPRDTAKAEALTETDIARAETIGNVHFVGERADIDACYAAFDLYALASYREGFPRSAMEAAAMGLPVVATDIRGCRQGVDDGLNSRRGPVRDPSGLAGATRQR